MTDVHSERKADHIRINLEEDVAFPRLTTGLERYHFIHRALPELDLNEIQTEQQVLGKKVAAPLLVSSMTGGTARAGAINRRLAAAAEHCGLALGLGSQRVALEVEDSADTFQVRDVAPNILLFANLGAIQLNYCYTVDHCRRAVEMIAADALILHLNPLQEALQADGNWNWRGLLEKIGRVCRQLEAPVIVKEVGWGISGEVARRLADVGVAVIDVAGAGGTSWSQVEMHRAPTEQLRRLAAAFGDWGIPTAAALSQVRAAVPELPIFASGGIRNGIEAVKCVALGATLVGLASPFLKAADESTERVIDEMEALIAQMRIAMFCAGARDIPALREPGRLVTVA